MKPRLSARHLCLSVACMLGLSAVHAQTTVTVGTGTGTSTNAPISSYYGYSYSQQLYYASDITTAGGPIGTITAIRFWYDANSTSNSDNWTILMANTTKTSFSNITDWVSVANMTQVFAGTVSFPAAGNWVDITLDTPFQWDGSSNIVVAVDENASSYSACCGATFRKTNSPENRTIAYWYDYSNPDPANPPSANSLFTYYPNMQFDITPAPDCSGTPATPAITATPNDTLCEGLPFQLSVPGVFETGIHYQWQEFDGTSWNDIVDDTNAVYMNDGIFASTDYRAIVSCEFSAMQAISDTAEMVINPNPTITVDLPESAICPGEVATITASGADTYSWSPGTALDNTNTATVNANPTSVTTYTVTGTDVNGCTNTATAKVIPNADITADMTISPNEMCAPGTPVTVTIDGLPMNASGGSWNYRFLGPDGITVEQKLELQ